MTPTITWMDAHCHLSEASFDAIRESLYDELIDQRISGLVLAGTDPSDWVRQEQLKPPAGIRLARVFGLHPWFVDSLSHEELERDLRILEGSLDRCQGIGEMGLDYFRAKSQEERDKQKHWFEAQLDVAKGRDLPLVLHVVRAHHESIPQIRRHQGSYRGLIHSFWAHADVARSYIDMGFLLSVPPRIMKEDPHRLLEKIDPEHIVFETDTPFKNAQGDLMKPTLIHEILEFAAARRGESRSLAASRQARLLSDLFPILKGT